MLEGLTKWLGVECLAHALKMKNHRKKLPQNDKDFGKFAAKHHIAMPEV